MTTSGVPGPIHWAHRWGPHAAPVMVVILLAVIGLGAIVVRPDGLFNRHSDLLAYHLGTQTVVHESWQREGRLPVWRSDILSGAPTVSSPQTLYTHPFHILFWFFPPAQVVGLVMWLEMLLAALGAYAAAGTLKLSTFARVFVAAAVLFSFKTILAAYAGWLVMLAGIAALPWLFAAIAIALERPSMRSTLALGAAGALSLHTGQLQLVYYGALFGGIWSTVRIGRLIAGGDRRAAARTVATLAGGLVIAVGLAAHVLLPLAYDAALVTRGMADHDYLVGGADGGAVSPLGLLTLGNPEALGTPLDGSFVEAWEYVIYLGALPSLFAILALLKGHRRPFVRVLVAGFALGVALASVPPLVDAAYTFIPGFNLFRLPGRALFLSAFFGACLAGFGFDELLSVVRERARSVVAVLAIAVVSVEGFAWGWRYLQVADPIPVVASAEYVKLLRSDDEPSRVAPLSRSIPHYGSAAPLGVQLVAGYDTFNFRHYQTYLDLLSRNHSEGPRPATWIDFNTVVRFDLLAALNVRYLVSPARIGVPPDEYTLISEYDAEPQFHFYEGIVRGPVYVYRNDRFLRRAFFVSEVVLAADEGAAVQALQHASARTTAVVLAPATGGTSSGSSADSIDAVSVRPGSLDFVTRSANRRFVVVSEVWHPGWQASVDHRAASLYRTDVALLGLWLEPGEHTVSLRFLPPGRRTGVIASGCTLVSVLVLASTRRPRRRPRGGLVHGDRNGRWQHASKAL